MSEDAKPNDWYLPGEAPLELSGFAWFERDRAYRRLPLDAPQAFREPVVELAKCTAGGQIRFRTDSPTVTVAARLTGAHNMDHMPATGQCGFDCYVSEAGAPRFVGVTRWDRATDSYECVVLRAPDAVVRQITLNFPLYTGVQEVRVGVEAGSQMLPPHAWADPRPVVVYGTSITQGGCACRPGMAYTNALSRWLNRPFINLGFSGNGCGDAEVAEAMAEIAGPAAYVLDYEPNSSLEGLQQTLNPFLDILRAAHPTVPILVVSRIRYAADAVDAASEARRIAARDFQRETVTRRAGEGDQALSFFDGGGLLGEDFDECTVDGVHPTDLGFLRIAQGLRPVLEEILT